MAVPPYDFTKFAVPRGAPLKSVLSARWYANLAKTLKAICPTAVENSGITVTYTEAGAFLWTTRPIPAYRLVRVGAGGIPGRNASTGVCGKAAVTNYRTEWTTGGVRSVVLDDSTTEAFNDLSIPVPANVDAKCLEEGGALIVLGWECEP